MRDSSIRCGGLIVRSWLANSFQYSLGFERPLPKPGLFLKKSGSAVQIKKEYVNPDAHVWERERERERSLNRRI